MVFLYQSTHEGAKDDPPPSKRKPSSVDGCFHHYKLKREDFPVHCGAQSGNICLKASSIACPCRQEAPCCSPAITKVPRAYEQLIANSMMAYLTPWEFVAERFHCQDLICVL